LGFVVLTQPTLKEGGEVSSVVGYGGKFFISAYLGQFEVLGEPNVQNLLPLLAFSHFAQILEGVLGL